MGELLGQLEVHASREQRNDQGIEGHVLLFGEPLQFGMEGRRGPDHEAPAPGNRRLVLMQGKRIATPQSRGRSYYRHSDVLVDFERAAKRALRETGEYQIARREGYARDWLNGEARSFADSAYMLLLQRVEEHGGDPHAQ